MVFWIEFLYLVFGFLHSVRSQTYCNAEPISCPISLHGSFTLLMQICKLLLLDLLKIKEVAFL